MHIVEILMHCECMNVFATLMEGSMIEKRDSKSEISPWDFMMSACRSDHTYCHWTTFPIKLNKVYSMVTHEESQLSLQGKSQVSTTRAFNSAKSTSKQMKRRNKRS